MPDLPLDETGLDAADEALNAYGDTESCPANYDLEAAIRAYLSAAGFEVEHRRLYEGSIAPLVETRLVGPWVEEASKR